MGLYQRFMNGLSGFYNGFMADPESVLRDLSNEQRMAFYIQCWNYYRQAMFSRRDGQSWTTYLASRELYKHTRLIYNPVPQIVDFYVDNVWQSAHNEQFESLVTPVSDKTDESIMSAVAQLDQWTNFLSGKNKMVRYSAATGNVLIEGIDDLEREKVTDKTVWAGYVTKIELNDSGDVLSYTVEYDVYDNAQQKTYRFKKEVSKEGFRYFKDDILFHYPDKPAAEYENPYGFCFAIWLKHTDDGSIYGTPACSNLDKVDDVNSLASHLFDNIHKEIESGKVIGLGDEPNKLTVISGASQNPDGSIREVDPRLERVLLAIKGNVSIADLSGQLKLAEAEPYLKNALLSFGADYPELEYRQILKENGGNLSGIALQRLLTPAQNKLDGVQANYNQQLVKLRQMQIAVAGYRFNGGGWTMKTNQQALFKDFNLDSYSKGNLDFQLKPSILIKPNEDEREETLNKKASRAKSLEGIVDHKEQLLIAGYSEEQADDILTRFEQEKARNQIEGGIPAIVGGKPPKMLGDGLPVSE